MNDFVRVASAVINTTVANTKKNVEEHIKMMEMADREKVDITVFPELSVTGYTCQDLFFQQELLESAEKGVRVITEESKKLYGTYIVGCPVQFNGQLYNTQACSCALSVNGFLRHNRRDERRDFKQAY